VGVLLVAQKARQAAEEASAVARLKSLVEELGQASVKVQQVGLFLRDRKWDIVQLRAEEILGGCELVLTRRGDHLDESSRNNLRSASTLARSIAGTAAESSMRELSQAERRQVLDAQLDAAKLIAAVVGGAQRAEERSHGRR
jgi:hypothetical protein